MNKILGKRSEFEKIEKDFYRTFDKRATPPLIPFIKGLKYVEPCFGAGDLAKQLENHCELVNFSDIETGVDALSITEDYVKDADVIITNPPWTRSILHPMIEHFANLRPTWLLFDADWMHTKQSSELMQKYCTKVVSIGRLTWIEGTKTSGKDNCCWYLFDKNKNKEIEFYGRVKD